MVALSTIGTNGDYVDITARPNGKVVRLHVSGDNGEMFSGRSETVITDLTPEQARRLAAGLVRAADRAEKK